MWWKAIDSSWTLFLDRDGVINKRILNGYVLSKADFKFLWGSKKAIAHFSKRFHRICVVTNQQGISKNLMSERNLDEIHRYMLNEVAKAHGKIDRCYYAPEAKGTPNGLRKPAPAMGLLAKREFPEIDFQKSIMVGDTDSDIAFGKNLGMKTVRIKTSEAIGIEADLTVNHLHDLIALW